MDEQLIQIRRLVILVVARGLRRLFPNGYSRGLLEAAVNAFDLEGLRKEAQRELATDSNETEALRALRLWARRATSLGDHPRLVELEGLRALSLHEKSSSRQRAYATAFNHLRSDAASKTRSMRIG